MCSSDLLEQCRDIQEQISALEQQLDSMEVNADDQADLQVNERSSQPENSNDDLCLQTEWDQLEEERKSIAEQQAQVGNKQQQINDEMRRIQQDLQSKANEGTLLRNVLFSLVQSNNEN